MNNSLVELVRFERVARLRLLALLGLAVVPLSFLVRDESQIIEFGAGDSAAALVAQASNAPVPVANGPGGTVIRGAIGGGGGLGQFVAPRGALGSAPISGNGELPSLGSTSSTPALVADGAPLAPAGTSLGGGQPGADFGGTAGGAGGTGGGTGGGGGFGPGGGSLFPFSPGGGGGLIIPASTPLTTTPPGNGNTPPITTPPTTTTPPVDTTPPVSTTPPVTTPPTSTTPPDPTPPANNPPNNNPPVTNPPVTNPPPGTTPPDATPPPGTNPPDTSPPPVTNPPVTNPPGTNPPGTNPPGTEPPPGGVPEPETWAMLAIGAVLALAASRRQRRGLVA